MAGESLPNNVNMNLPSPDELYMGVVKANFWKKTLTNNDFLQMYKRKGIAYRTINKQVQLMFKNGWNSEDQVAINIADEFEFDSYIKYAYKNALISKYALIYVDYGDISNKDYSIERPVNGKALGYYVITRAWIHRDIYEDQKVYDYYEIYQADGTTFRLHKSRVIRVQPEDCGKIEPAYDSLMVLDNVLWGIGQTMFRSGSGFPVLSVLNGMNIIDSPNGEKLTKIQYYKKTGLMNDMNTQTGFVLDSNDKLTFEGANGKAINPGEYYDRAFQQCAVDLDVPVDILKGTAAGAITGSETNLKEYYGDLAAKQELHLTPIYYEMFETQQYYKIFEIKWEPIFEQTQTEVTNNLKNDADTVHKMELYGYYTHEQAVNYFADTYEVLDYSEEEINALKDLPVYEKKEQAFSFGNQSPEGSLDSSSCSCGFSHDEESALPAKAQKTESKYMKDLNKAFSTTQENVIKLLQAFNTDEKV